MLGTSMHPTADRTPETTTADVQARWPSAAPECPPTSLVGRDTELAELRRLVRDRRTPFITLAGSAGWGRADSPRSSPRGTSGHGTGGSRSSRSTA